jgi:hypothetical protein
MIRAVLFHHPSPWPILHGMIWRNFTTVFSCRIISFSLSAAISPGKRLWKYSGVISANGKLEKFRLISLLQPENQRPDCTVSTRKLPSPQLSVASLQQAKPIPIFTLSPYLILLSAAAGFLQEFSAPCAIMKDLPTAPEASIVPDLHTEFLEHTPLQKRLQP